MNVEISSNYVPDEGGGSGPSSRTLRRRRMLRRAFEKAGPGSPRRIASPAWETGVGCQERRGLLVARALPHIRAESGEIDASYDHFLRFVHPADKDKVTGVIADALQREKLFGLDHRIIRKDGAERIVHALAEVTRDEQGEVIRFAGTVLDVTERVQALECARSNVELEKFAYVASHDLQEPLSLISGFAAMLKKRYGRSLDRNAGEYIEYIISGVERMQTMIDDMLAYSRIRPVGSPLEPVDGNEVLDMALSNLTMSIEKTHAAISRDPLPMLMARKTELLQLFQNLLSNAIKFHRIEPPEVSVSVGRADGQWLISVKDNGIGIPKIHLIECSCHSSAFILRASRPAPE